MNCSFCYLFLVKPTWDVMGNWLIRTGLGPLGGTGNFAVRSERAAIRLCPLSVCLSLRRARNAVGRGDCILITVRTVSPDAPPWRLFCVSPSISCTIIQRARVRVLTCPSSSRPRTGGRTSVRLSFNRRHELRVSPGSYPSVDRPRLLEREGCQLVEDLEWRVKLEIIFETRHLAAGSPMPALNFLSSITPRDSDVDGGCGGFQQKS